MGQTDEIAHEGRKRGRYVTCDPEAGFRLQTPSIGTRRGKAILRNGMSMAPIGIDGRPVKVTYTCAFDSVTELFVNAYMISQTFKTLVDENATDNFDDYFKLLQVYATKGVGQAIYSRRAHVLQRVLKDHAEANKDPGILNCWSSPSEMTAGAVKPDFHCLLQQTCTRCGEQWFQSQSTIELAHVDVHTEGLAKLEEALNRASLMTIRSECATCFCREVAMEALHVGTFIQLDVQGLFGQSSSGQYKCALSEIPSSLDIQESQYVLVGAIAHTSGHFVPYCRQPSGRWDERNDCGAKPERHPQTLTQTKEKKVFNTFMYVKCDM